MTGRSAMRPEGRRVFITGGTGGIGQPLVALLREAGATVTVHDRARHGAFPAALDSVCAALAADPPDILITMAGINRFSRCEDQPAEDLLALNLLAPIRLTQAVLLRADTRIESAARLSGGSGKMAVFCWWGRG